MSNQPHYKALYEHEMRDHKRTQEKYNRSLTITILTLLALFAANLALWNGRTALKQARTAIEQSSQTLKEAQDKAYMVWQMDTSCFAQLKSANMIQLVIKE